MTTPVVTPEVEKKATEPRRAAPAKKAVAKKKAARRRATKQSNIPAKRAKKVSRKVKATKRRPFPNERVAKLWEKGKTLTEISKAIGIFNIKSDDPNHRLRVALTGMHKGWRDSKGKLHKLPHRVKKSSLAASRRAGKKAAA